MLIGRESSSGSLAGYCGRTKRKSPWIQNLIMPAPLGACNPKLGRGRDGDAADIHVVGSFQMRESLAKLPLANGM